MKRIYCFLLILAFALVSITSVTHAQGTWTEIGATDNGSSLVYYKLLQVNAASHEYSTIIELNIEGNPDSYQMQGTYIVRVNKSAATTTRFDGLEVQCTSGNQGVATFYIYNNALWVRSNFLSGKLYYRIYADFRANSPMNATPFGQTTSAPVGFATTVNSGVKCDFDNNVFTKLPVTDLFGVQNFFNNVSVARDAKIGAFLTDGFAYDGKTQPHYGFQWTSDSWNSNGASYWLSGYSGIKMFTTGAPRLVITSIGNVGIGTVTPTYKLTVDGTIGARRVKATQETWADFVFEPDYKLPSLAEIEAYIKEHKHLPDVPSAKEVTKQGLDLGEMNKILLQKIEELTLHLIEESKRNSELEAEMKEMSERLKRLESK